MRLSELKIAIISASLLILCVACSSGDENGVDLKTPWLGPLQGFDRVSGKDGSGVFVKDTVGATDRFERGILLPPEIIVSARSHLQSITPAAYQNIKAMFAEAFRQELAKQIPIAPAGTELAAASHLIQLALINITVTRKTNSPFAAQLSDLQVSFQGSTIEVDIRARKSNARQAVIILPATAGSFDWNALRVQVTVFARQAAAEIGKAHSAINAKADQPPPPAAKKPAKK